MNHENELYPLGDLSHFVVHDLPSYNTSNQLTDACIKAEHLMPDVSLVLHIAYQEPFITRIRAMGDLGMILVLFSRAGMDAEPIIQRLKLLSETVGVVPRDTYASYVTYNPTNALRTFTGNESEFHFIRQLQKSDSALGTAAECLLQLQSDPFQVNGCALLEQAISAIAALKKETSTVHKTVDPIFFFNDFRQYFFPIRIDGKEFAAPSAVHLANQIIVDIVSGACDDEYLAITESLFPYFEPINKLRITQAMKSPNLKYVYTHSPQGNVSDHLKLLGDLYEGLITYRKVHQSLVTRYIRIQDKTVKYGTGGFLFDSFLQRRIDMIEEAKKELEVHMNV